MEKVTGHLEVGCNASGEVIINHPNIQPEANGAGHIVFSPNQARALGRLLFKKASEADGFPGTGEDGEYFVNFNTKAQPGKVEAVRVRIDYATIDERAMHVPFRIDLCEHPLYRELIQYVKANPR